MAETGISRFFELRFIIAVLFVVYGIVCVVWGLGFTSERELEKAAGYNVNLLAGIGMLVIGVLFGIWALVKPLEPATSSPEQSEADAETAVDSGA